MFIAPRTSFDGIMFGLLKFFPIPGIATAVEVGQALGFLINFLS